MTRRSHGATCCVSPACRGSLPAPCVRWAIPSRARMRHGAWVWCRPCPSASTCVPWLPADGSFCRLGEWKRGSSFPRGARRTPAHACSLRVSEGDEPPRGRKGIINDRTTRHRALRMCEGTPCTRFTHPHPAPLGVRRVSTPGRRLGRGSLTALLIAQSHAACTFLPVRQVPPLPRMSTAPAAGHTGRRPHARAGAKGRTHGDAPELALMSRAAGRREP